MDKEKILKKFCINKNQEFFFEKYIEKLTAYNLHTNIVGKSTLLNPWISHILDSIQITFFIKDKNLSILDMGTGAGLPGYVLSIAGYKNVTLIDSNGKKIFFLKKIKKEIKLDVKIIMGRIEAVNNIKFDIVTSRALTNLSRLFSYSQKFLKKNTVLIFLKGKTVNEELIEAQKKWNFQFTKHQSISDPRGQVLVVKDLKKI